VKDFLAIFCGQEIHELAIEYVQERGYMGMALSIKGYATDELLFYQPVVLLLFHRGHFKNHKEPFLSFLKFIAMSYISCIIFQDINPCRNNRLISNWTITNRVVIDRLAKIVQLSNDADRQSN